MTGTVYVDLDQFKPVNDTLGHAAGDELLDRSSPSACRLASRDTDLIGRLGGDEFLVVLRDVRGEDMAMRAARRIADAPVRQLRAVVRERRARARASASPARAASRSPPKSSSSAADAAMYESKEQGECVPVLASAASLRGAPSPLTSPSSPQRGSLLTVSAASVAPRSQTRTAYRP